MISRDRRLIQITNPSLNPTILSNAEIKGPQPDFTAETTPSSPIAQPAGDTSANSAVELLRRQIKQLQARVEELEGENIDLWHLAEAESGRATEAEEALAASGSSLVPVFLAMSQRLIRWVIALALDNSHLADQIKVQEAAALEVAAGYEGTIQTLRRHEDELERKLAEANRDRHRLDHVAGELRAKVHDLDRELELDGRTHAEVFAQLLAAKKENEQLLAAQPLLRYTAGFELSQRLIDPICHHRHVIFTDPGHTPNDPNSPCYDQSALSRTRPLPGLNPQGKGPKE